jgi:uncharacterized Zn finger protein (UPF0148 family)
MNIRCDVCGADLVKDDKYMSCPIYMSGKTKEADEHTSVSIQVEEMEKI